jgi:cysteine desulfurase
MRRPVYLDYAATTPVDPGVAAQMARCLTAPEAFGNPSSSHVFGRMAAALIARARAQVAGLIGARAEEIVFTSGATESNNLAVLGVARTNGDRGRHLVCSRIEHKSVLDVGRRLEREGFRVTWLTPDDSGRIDPQAVRAALRADTVLVSIQHVNNEIGVIQDIGAIGEACREAGVPLHTDAAQSAGRICVEVTRIPVDFMSLTAHKIYGPKGIGALYVRSAARALLAPQSFGGGQEQGLRPGTPATHQIVGFGAAAELAAEMLEGEAQRIGGLSERLWGGLQRLPGIHLNGAAAPRVPHILNVSFDEVDGESLLASLARLAASTGSACSSASGDPSYVLRALGRGARLAESSLRLSLGRFTTAEEVDCAAAAIRREVIRLRSVGPRPADGPARGEGGAERSREPGARPGGEAGAVGPEDGSGGVDAGRGALDSRPEGRIEAPVEGEPDAGVSGLEAEAYRLFRELPGAGRFPDAGTRGAGCPGRADGETVLHGEAGGPTQEVWVRFHVKLDGDTVKDARFEARGCPHTLAAAAWIASRLPGRRRADGAPGGPHEWARELGVPVEKLGRLLVLEDALAACGLSQTEADRR